MNPSQRYVSRELTHFVGQGQGGAAQYSLLVKVLRTGWLTHPPHDPNAPSKITILREGRFSRGEMYNPDVVCFCDIPVGDLHLHIQKYSPFGVAFLKTFLIPMGANPVFYIANNSLVDISHSPVFRNLDVRPGCGLGRPGHLATREEVFDKLMSANAATDRKLYSVLNQCDVTEERSAHIPEGLPDLIFDSRYIQRELSKLVFSFCVPFDDAQEEEGEKNYYMEREWRTLGNVQFQLTDVHRIILPETYAVQLRADVPDYCGQVTFAD